MAERSIVIATARCSSKLGMYGLRLERVSLSNWAVTWAFAIKEQAAKKEGYDQTRVMGSMSMAEAFPGCPHCRAKAFFKCGACGKLGCWNGEDRTVTCPWCNTKTPLTGEITSLDAGTDR